MPYNEFQENWKKFSELVDQLPKSEDEQLNTLMNRYIQQNLMILNEVFTTSIENMQRLEKAKTTNDVICIQARFINELNKKLALSMQRFLNASLGDIADYNEWLKAHCDFATD